MTPLVRTNNHLFALARLGHLRLPRSFSERTRRVIDRGIYPIIVLLYGLSVPLWSALLAFPIMLILVLLQGQGLDYGALTDNSNPLLLLLPFLPIYFLVWFWLWLFEKRHIWTAGLEWPGWLRKYLRGLLIGVLMFGASLAILALSGHLVIEEVASGPGSLSLLGGSLLFLLAWMVQGGAEEILARGLVLPVIGVRFGPWIGVILSSALFMALHLLNPNLSSLALANLFLFGFFAALFALYEGGLWGVFAIHTAWNWAQGNLFGFEVSGSELNTAVLLNLNTNGPDWLTGGAFGPEGGVAVTAVLLAGILLVWLANRRRSLSVQTVPVDDA